MTPTTNPVLKLVENARYFNHLAVKAFRSYSELEGSEGLRVRFRYQNSMRALAWKTLREARETRNRLTTRSAA